MLRTNTRTPAGLPHSDVTVRLADYADSRALLRLAALDSARFPDGRLVVAEVGGRVVAALPVDGGRGIADPFQRTAALLEMLELRAAQLRAETGSGAPSFTERIRGLARTRIAA